MSPSATQTSIVGAITVPRTTLTWCLSRTGKEAVISFDNPQRNLLLYLQLAGLASSSAIPQQVAIVVGDQTVERLVVPTDADAIRTTPIPAAVLGTTDRVELKLCVDRTFVPPSDGHCDDERELGFRVLRMALAIL